MKFAVSVVSLAAIASLTIVEAVDLQGHAVPLVRNPGHKKNLYSQIAKIAKRYPQLNLNQTSTASAKMGSVVVTDDGDDTEV